MTDAPGLDLVSVSAAGAVLHLRPGDRLCRINGLAFAGTVADLTSRMAAGGPLALGFRRADREFAVLSHTAALGTWHPAAAAPLAEGTRLYPQMLCNWEVMAAPDGCYDLHPLPPSRLALLAAPLWLLQMRLWGLAAGLTAALALAFAAAPWLAVPVYLLASVHVWRAGSAYVRADRRLRGLQPVAVLAARTEAGAHEGWTALEPRARFLFARARPVTAAAPA